METWISQQQNSLWAQDFLYYFLFEGLGERRRGLHSSPLFRLSNPAVTQPTNRMPSSGLCHLYLSESWRGNKDISSTALVRLLVFTENECGRAEGLRVPLRCREATWRRMSAGRGQKCDVSVWNIRGWGDGVGLQEETMQRGKRSVHFSFARKKPHTALTCGFRQTSSCQRVPRHSSRTLILLWGRFVLCLTSVFKLRVGGLTRWRMNGGLGKAVGGRVVRVVALGAADFLQRQLCRQETGNWFFWCRRVLHGIGGPKQTETRNLWGNARARVRINWWAVFTLVFHFPPRLWIELRQHTLRNEGGEKK